MTIFPQQRKKVRIHKLQHVGQDFVLVANLTRVEQFRRIFEMMQFLSTFALSIVNSNHFFKVAKQLKHCSKNPIPYDCRDDRVACGGVELGTRRRGTYVLKLPCAKSQSPWSLEIIHNGLVGCRIPDSCGIFMKKVPMFVPRILDSISKIRQGSRFGLRRLEPERQRLMRKLIQPTRQRTVRKLIIHKLD